jgi:hypothetical protein
MTPLVVFAILYWNDSPPPPPKKSYEYRSSKFKTYSFSNSTHTLKTCCNMLGAVELPIGTTNIREVRPLRHRINRINTLSHSEGS